MSKAAREAKAHTSWISPNPNHESALREFVDAIFQVEGRNRFLTDLTRFHKELAFYGAMNSLSQLLLKITSPGIPDFYQGEEIWDFNLVDPDNRRPVDFAARARLLDELKAAEQRDLAALLADLMVNWRDGRIKLYVTWKASRFRREQQDLFKEGEYVPLVAKGKARGNLCAFARKTRKQWAISVAPRFISRLVDPEQWPVGTDIWGSTSLLIPRGAPTAWKHVLTGQSVNAGWTLSHSSRLSVASVLQTFPVALLCAEADD
jgi:(1->4)-alpha-D-glucan 1-alpha-D-glucosylmutase